MIPRRRPLIVSLAVCTCFVCGCGYIGDPQPPSLRIPVAVSDLAAVEQGGQILVSFTAPSMTTDGVVLRTLHEIDLQAGARSIPVTSAKPGPVHVELPVSDWVGQDLVLRVRTSAVRERYSQWSNAVHMKVLPPFERPVLKAESVKEGVRLTWTRVDDAAYRIFRRAPAEPRQSLLATAKKPEYTDTQAQYAKTYEYSVEAFLSSGDAEVRGEPSQTVSITPEDRFPPAVPTGLTAIAGISSIELSWTPDTEPDLRGYYVYRSAGDGPLEKIGGLIETPVYGDRAIEAGKSYSYAVSAIDQNGNESARSSAVEATALPSSP
jgi:hypothetical protein